MIASQTVSGVIARLGLQEKLAKQVSCHLFKLLHYLDQNALHLHVTKQSILFLLSDIDECSPVNSSLCNSPMEICINFPGTHICNCLPGKFDYNAIPSQSSCNAGVFRFGKL